MNPRPYPLQCLKGSAGQFDTGATIICFVDNNAHKLNVLFTKIIKIETVFRFLYKNKCKLFRLTNYLPKQAYLSVLLFVYLIVCLSD
jgi:hypothetical protein